MENWLGSSLNQIQGLTGLTSTVRESYSRALEQGPVAREGHRERDPFKDSFTVVAAAGREPSSFVLRLTI